jgi:hypothetical protein
MKLVRTIICGFIAFTCVYTTQAQNLNGIWTGKIIRTKSSDKTIEFFLEIQINQNGRTIEGYSYSFKDTSMYSRFQIFGNLDKSNKLVLIQEIARTNFYKMPETFFPCVKSFELLYSKIGKDQYLTGSWTGEGINGDTSCFPNEELTVYLKREKKSKFNIANQVKKDFENYLEDLATAIMQQRNKNALRDINKETDTLAPQKPADNTIVNQDSVIYPYTNRETVITKLISTEQREVEILLYDNGIVDNDTVSIFINKQRVIRNAQLSGSPISYKFLLATDQPAEVLMQAENLGSIPPNTAVMIVKTGGNQYSVSLSSDYKSSAAVLIQWKKP